MRFWTIGAAIAVAAQSASAAASDLAKFYHAVPHRTADVRTNADPIIHESSGDAEKDLAAMETAGFELIGYSSFNGKEAGQKAVAKQAKIVGATDVVYNERYTDTQSTGAIGSTSFSRWSAFTFVAPMSVRRYDQLAMYFRKAPRQGLGIYPRPLTNEEKSALGSNKGIAIVAVTNGSPAFMADILPGDILVQLNGQGLWDADSIKAAIDSAKGKTSEIQIFRNGQLVTKQVSIPAADW